MIQLAICSFLIGAVFGLRFKVMALLPITVMGGASIGASALLMNQSALAAFSGIAIWAVAMQTGFLFGSLSRVTVAAARGARATAKPSAVETVR